jgi:diguanylate cyclase (GGDEF)-like protein
MVIAPVAPKNNIITWYTFFILITILRYILTLAYKRRTKQNSYLLWRNLFILGAFMGGVAWSMSIEFFFGAPTIQQTVQCLIIAGISAGAVPLYSGIVTAAIVFLITALLPLIVYLLTSTINPFIFLGITIGFYLVYLIMLSLKQFNLIEESIGLRYQNETLVKDLLDTKKQLESINQKLHQAATHDPLTNLANRNLLEESLQQAINRAERQKKMLALFYIDLDGFKQVNDTYGHAMGDILLLAVVKRLKENMRESDIIARLGGDEFIVILEDILEADSVKSLAQDLINKLNEAYVLNKILTVNITVSIGISIYPSSGYDVETLLRSADNAMYHVKQHGRNNFYLMNK